VGEPLARLRGADALGLRPPLAQVDELRPDLRDQREDQRGDVLEVAVEDRPRVAGALHHGLRAELAEGLLAQEGLCRIEDLAAGLLPLLAALRALDGDGHGRAG